MSSKDMAGRSCQPCEGGVPALGAAQVTELKAGLDPDWRCEDNARLVRRFDFKGFAKAQAMANMAAFIGDREGHHPDIAFGWGYCEVTFTTHDVGGLSENDFICAAKIDRALS